MNFKIGNIINDKEILEFANKDVKYILSKDPKLSSIDNKLIRNEFNSIKTNSVLWKHIS